MSYYWDQFIEFSDAEKTFFVHPDRMVTMGKKRPTWEEMVEGSMKIPTYVCTKRPDQPGYAMSETPTYWTREYAERAATAYMGEPEPQSEAA